MGDTLLDEAGVKSLAAMPSLDELRGTIVGLLVAPQTKIARVLVEPATSVARVLSAYAATGE
jgi:large subunit ribosomal protein L10